MRFLAVVLTALSILLAVSGCIAPSESYSSEEQTQDQALNFANSDRLDEHWRKHGLNPGEFNPVLTKSQYLKRARALFESSDSDVLQKESYDGDTLRYRPSTNEFGVLSSQGVIRTYFRPDTGMSYWERQ